MKNLFIAVVMLFAGALSAQVLDPSEIGWRGGQVYNIQGTDYTVPERPLRVEFASYANRNFDWTSLTWPTYGGNNVNFLRLIAEINSPNDGGGAGVPISTRVERGGLSAVLTVSLEINEAAVYVISPIRRDLITFDDFFADTPLLLGQHELELARVRAMANDPSNYNYVTQYIYTVTGRVETLSVSDIDIFTNTVTDGRATGQMPPNAGEVRRNVWWRLGDWYSAQFSNLGATIGATNELSSTPASQYLRLDANSFRSQDRVFMRAFYDTTEFEVVWSYQNHATLNDAVLFTGESIAGSYSFGDSELDRPHTLSSTERIIHIKRDNATSPWRIESYGPAVGTTSTIRQVINSIGY